MGKLTENEVHPSLESNANACNYRNGYSILSFRHSGLRSQGLKLYNENYVVKEARYVTILYEYTTVTLKRGHHDICPTPESPP